MFLKVDGTGRVQFEGTDADLYNLLCHAYNTLLREVPHLKTYWDSVPMITESVNRLRKRKIPREV